MKKYISGLFICLILLYNGASGALAEPAAKAACILDLLTGRVLYEYQADVQLPMASTTKVMTALLALERAALNDRVVCGSAAYGVPGTSIYLSLGESLTMEEMLQGLLLASGNDAATAIAEHIGGSVEGFAELMNARAQELGAVNTHFVNPHGLPASDHYTTARDLAIIAREAMSHPVFRQIVSTQRASIPWEGHSYNRQLRNKNKLLATYPGATGIKTGYTRAAGRCLVFGADHDGMEVVGVILNSPDWFSVAAELLDQSFAEYRQLIALEKGEALRSIPVRQGVYPSVDAVLGGPLSAPLSEHEQPYIEISLPEELEAPVTQGTVIGMARLRTTQQVLCEQPLYIAHDVPESTIWNHLVRILRKWCLLS